MTVYSELVRLVLCVITSVALSTGQGKHIRIIYTVYACSISISFMNTSSAQLMN